MQQEVQVLFCTWKSLLHSTLFMLVTKLSPSSA
jgi:hypothetical protein